MIHVEIQNADNDDKIKVYMRECPRAGEFIWFTSGDWGEAKSKFGATSVQVITVAHWVTSAWSPNTHQGEPIHSACLIVKPTT